MTRIVVQSHDDTADDSDVFLTPPVDSSLSFRETPELASEGKRTCLPLKSPHLLGYDEV